MKRQTIMRIIGKVAKLIVNLKVTGYEDLPQAGGFLLTTSHTSRLDTPFLMLSTPRQDVIAILADKYKKKFFFGWFLESVGVIWMNREVSDFGAFRKAVDHLKKGWIVGIAPEGTRSADLKLQEAKPGAALLASKAGVPVVPAGITGSHDMGKRLLRFQKMDVHVNFGKAYYLPPMDNNDHKAWLAACTDEIMCRIAALLPPENRGVYAEHPRLKELLQEAESAT